MKNVLVRGALAGCFCMIVCLGGCAGKRSEIGAVSLGSIPADLASFENQRVRLCGHPLATATIALCPGYIGLDTRTHLTDADGNTIVVAGSRPSWTPGSLPGGADECGELWAYEGYIRVFRGEIGCPGEIRFEEIPYIEIASVR